MPDEYVRPLSEQIESGAVETSARLSLVQATPSSQGEWQSMVQSDPNSSAHASETTRVRPESTRLDTLETQADAGLWGEIRRSLTHGMSAPASDVRVEMLQQPDRDSNAYMRTTGDPLDLDGDGWRDVGWSNFVATHEDPQELSGKPQDVGQIGTSGVVSDQALIEALLVQRGRLINVVDENLPVEHEAEVTSQPSIVRPADVDKTPRIDPYRPEAQGGPDIDPGLQALALHRPGEGRVFSFMGRLRTDGSVAQVEKAATKPRDDKPPE